MRKRKILSFVLAVALCMGLTVPAFAAEKSLWPDYYSLESTYTKVEKNYDVYRTYDITAEPFTLESYYAIAHGTSFTLTNVRDDAGYVYFYLEPFTMQTTPAERDVDGVTKDLQGEYVAHNGANYFMKRDGQWIYGPDEGLQDIFYLGLNSPDDYVNYWSGLLLYSGESVTFTLPDDGKDTIYLLWVCHNNPETGEYVWQYSEFKYNDSAAPADAVAGFTDVHKSDYYADAVAWAAENGVTKGTSSTTFSPSAPATRAQAVTFLWRAAGSPEPASMVSPFTDVTNTGAYYYKAVLWAAEQGITKGVGKATFDLNGTLNYDQLLALLCRAAGGDASGSDWSAKAVAWAKENGLTDGLTFTAKDSCPRADVVYCLWKQLA